MTHHHTFRSRGGSDFTVGSPGHTAPAGPFAGMPDRWGWAASR